MALLDVAAKRDVARKRGRAVTHSTDEVSSHKCEDKESFYGFDPIPADGVTVTNELVNELREELGI